MEINGWKWKWCPMCGAHVICPNCGNNCCNGGTIDGCGCRAAYKEQDLAYKEKRAPKQSDFSQEEQEEVREWWEDYFD